LHDFANAYGHPILDGNGRTLMVIHSVLRAARRVRHRLGLDQQTNDLTALTKEIDTPGESGRHPTATAHAGHLRSEERDKVQGRPAREGLMLVARCRFILENAVAPPVFRRQNFLPLPFGGF
jgi:hypothetical protein